MDDVRYEPNKLLLSDNAILKVDSEEKLQMLMNMFCLVCKKMKLKVNIKCGYEVQSYWEKGHISKFEWEITVKCGLF